MKNKTNHHIKNKAIVSIGNNRLNLSFVGFGASVMDYLEKKFLWYSDQAHDFYFIRCPFQESNPEDMFVDSKNDTFFCHSCGYKGEMKTIRTRLRTEKKTTLEKWRAA